MIYPKTVGYKWQGILQALQVAQPTINIVKALNGIEISNPQQKNKNSLASAPPPDDRDRDVSAGPAGTCSRPSELKVQFAFTGNPRFTWKMSLNYVNSAVRCSTYGHVNHYNTSPQL